MIRWSVLRHVGIFFLTSSIMVLTLSSSFVRSALPSSSTFLSAALLSSSCFLSLVSSAVTWLSFSTLQPCIFCYYLSIFWGRMNY